MIAVLLGLACSRSSEPTPLPSPTPPPAPAPAPAPPAWSADLHVDTLTELGDRGVGFDDPGLEAGLPALTAGGTNVVVNVIWPPRDADHEAYTRAQLDAFDVRMAEVADRMVLVRSPDEADDAVRSGRIASLLALEGAHGIAASGLEGLRMLHGRGLRMLGLTWSLSNRFAGSSGDAGGGLTDDGRALLAEAQRLGILVDVSHASRQATLDACAVTRAPLIASHSNARSVRDVPRNLSPEEIRCIAGSGGVIGVMFHAPFVADGEVDVARVADQVEALVAVAGIDHVAVGSDWDGDIQVPAGLESARGLPALWAALGERGLGDEAIAKIRGANFRRAWSEAAERAQGL
jgi:membrane dipeptidase